MRDTPRMEYLDIKFDEASAFQKLFVNVECEAIAVNRVPARKMGACLSLHVLQPSLDRA